MRKASKIAIPMCSLAMAVSAYAANTNTPPTADFSVSIDGNYIKVKSKAADADGDVLKHKWSFGDKASSVAVNPGHTYAAEGIYSLRLKVSDGKASAVKTQEIKIPNNPPVPDFEIASRNLLKLKFQSKASDPENDAVKVKWNFGDGKTSTALNPGHTYAEAGTYTVTLSVNDGYHASVKKSMEVTVNDKNHAPEAGFAISKPKSNKMYVKVVSSATDADNDPLKYRYDFGDNTASTAENPGHTYKNPGTYTITQKVSDGTSSAIYTKTVIVGDPEDPEPTTKLSVQIIDGYLENAQVYVDLNRNYEWDENEPSGNTDIDGKVTFDIPDTQLVDADGNRLKNLKVIAKSIKGSKNHVFGTETELKQNMVLSSNVFLADAADAKDSDAPQVNVVSPFTTLADMAISNETAATLTEDDYRDQIATIASGIGVNDADVVTGNYNDHASEANIKAMVAGELLVRTNLMPQNEAAMQNVSENTKSTTESIVRDIAQYKVNTEAAVHIIKNAAQEGGNVSANVVGALEAAEAKLGSAFRTITSGGTDEWRCGVTRDNNVFCWGNNSWATLGDPSLYDSVVDGSHGLDGTQYPDNFSATPVAVKIKDKDGNFVPLSNVKSVAVASVHACAVTYAGELYCWGHNYWGQLGVIPEDEEITEDKERFAYAQKVLAGEQESKSGYLTDVEEAALGQDHTCALMKDGSVYCWGKNFSYQLGGDYPEHTKTKGHRMNMSGQIDITDFQKYVMLPVKVKFPDSVARVTAVRSGYWAHCALVENVDKTDKHNLYCWGSDHTVTISKNKEQYRTDFEAKYAGKIKRNDPNEVYKWDEPWNWLMYEDSGSYTPIYGQPVTLMRSINGTEIEDVKDVAITNFDGNIYMLMRPEHAPGDPEEPGVYGLYGTWGPEFWLHYNFDDLFDDDETAVRIYSGVEDELLYVLSSSGKAIFTGTNRYGMAGQGDDFGLGDNVWRLPIRDPKGYRPLTNITELSVTKRSVCAATTTYGADPSQIDYGFYCWGSSTFGQMGWDNGDNGFSYAETVAVWDGAANEYFDKPTRIEKLPKKICMFDPADTSCSAAQDPEHGDQEEIPEVIENPIESNSVWYEPTGRVNAGKVFVDRSASIPESCHVPANSIIIKTDFYDRVYVHGAGSWSDTFGDWPGTRATKVEGCKNEVYAVPIPEGYDPENEGEGIIRVNDGELFYYATDDYEPVPLDSPCFAMTSTSEGGFVSAWECGVRIEGAVLEDDVYVYSEKTGKTLRNGDAIRINEKDIEAGSGALELTLLISGPGVTSQSSGTFWFDDGNDASDPQKFINGEIIELGSKIDLAINEDKEVTLHVKYNDVEAVYPVKKWFDTKDETCRMNKQEENLGAIYSPEQTVFRVWSPDSSDVVLNLNGDSYPMALTEIACYDHIYEVTVPGDQVWSSYSFVINGQDVRDPYGKTKDDNNWDNHTILDMSATEPEGGWVERPALNSRTDAIIYGTHVRDFTISETSGVSQENRGMYLGMVETGTRYNDPETGGIAVTGIDHLKELGITHIQLQPIMDFSTCSWTNAQDLDCYNFGYDVHNFNVPADYFSAAAKRGEDQVARIKEVKTMINEFHKNGIRVILEIPYGHVYDDMLSSITGKYFINPDAQWVGYTLNADNSMVWTMIRDSMDYWVSEYHIDGIKVANAGDFSVKDFSDWAEYLNRQHPDANLIVYGDAQGQIYEDQELIDNPVRYGTIYQQSQDAHAGVLRARYRNCLTAGGDYSQSAFIFGDVNQGWDGNGYDENENWFEENSSCMLNGMRAGVRSPDAPAPADVWMAAQGFGEPDQSMAFVSTHSGATLRDRIATYVGNDGLPKDDDLVWMQMQSLAQGAVLLSQGIPVIYGGDEFGRSKMAAEDFNNTDMTTTGANDFDWSLKTTYWGKVSAYTAGLIKLRKAHPAFRMTNAGDILEGVKLDYDTLNDYPTQSLVAFDIDGSRAGDSWSRIKVVMSSDPNNDPRNILNAEGMVRVGCEMALDIPDAQQGDFPLWGLQSTDNCSVPQDQIQGPSITILAEPQQE